MNTEQKPNTKTNVVSDGILFLCRTSLIWLSFTPFSNPEPSDQHQKNLRHIRGGVLFWFAKMVDKTHISIFQNERCKGIWPKDQCPTIVEISDQLWLIRGPKGELALLARSMLPDGTAKIEYADQIDATRAMSLLRQHCLPVPGEITREAKGLLGRKEHLALAQYDVAARHLPSPSAEAAFKFLIGEGAKECIFCTGQIPNIKHFPGWAKALSRARTKMHANKRRRTSRKLKGSDSDEKS